jgi:oligopeptide/dipeptide ABC transporter ATP-binding protein
MSRITSGRIIFDGQDLASLDEASMQKIRGRRIACIFQEPMAALNPVLRVGDQLAEAIRIHDGGASGLSQRCLQLFDQVGIASAAQRLRAYPHELSGGMRQRVMIAMAISAKPELLIADEPTTALDVTIQAQILRLLKSLQRDLGMSMIFISHDLSVIAAMADEIAVMYGGTVVEKAGRDSFFRRQYHPYSQALLAALPREDLAPKSRLTSIEGQVPKLVDMPQGCKFANRCPRAIPRCSAEEPVLESTGTSVVACLRWRELHRFNKEAG